MAKKYTKNEILAICESKFDKKFDYSKLIYINSTTPFIVGCPIHGFFEIIPWLHYTTKYGCPDCSFEASSKTRSISFEVFEKESNNKHNFYYTYYKDFYKDAKSKTKINCPIHGDFWQMAGAHMRGRGCWKCAGLRSSTRQLKGQENFENECFLIHGLTYDYSKAKYTGYEEYVTIICKIHGEFEQTPGAHLHGQGCPKCGVEKRVAQQTNSKEQFLNSLTEEKRNFFDYSKTEYKGQKIKICIICPLHGEFWTAPDNHKTSPTGCSKCTKVAMSKLFAMGEEKFKEEAVKLHGLRYDYSLVVYKNNQTPVSIICKRHGVFNQMPAKHLDKKKPHGCPKCKDVISFSETQWLNLLNIPNDDAHRNVLIKIGKRKIKVDGFIPETNTIYEFHGDYWHGNPEVHKPSDINIRTGKTFGELYLKTIERENLIKNAGYNLITIWEKEWRKLNE